MQVSVSQLLVNFTEGIYMGAIMAAQSYPNHKARLRYLAATSAALMLAAGCADTENLGPQSEQVETPQETDAEQDETAASEATADEAEDPAEEPAADEADAEVENQLIVEFDDPFVWEEAGIRLAVTGIGITDATSDDVGDDIRSVLDEGTETVVVLAMQVSNDSGEAINVYANQGEIQVGREQVEADLFLSDSFAGGDMRDGVDDDGQVFWSLRSAWEEVTELGELDLIISGPSSSDTFDRLADDIELQVTW